MYISAESIEILTTFAALKSVLNERKPLVVSYFIKECEAH